MNKKLIIGIIALLLILTGGGYAAKKYLDGKNPTVSINSNSNVETKINKTLYTQYLNEAMKYRTEGFTEDTSAFYKAIDVYKKALEVSGEKDWVVYLNLGNTYRLIKDYNSAEEVYVKALKNAPSEDSIYLAKIEMYRYELNKSNSEIEKVYNEALEKVIDNSNVTISYAAFLRDIGDNQKALKYYRLLEEKYPDNQSYKNEIEELKAK